MKKLQHPNISQLYEVIETSELICMVIEYASGGELFDYIVARERLSENTAKKMYMQIMNAVEYIHLSGVAHRDLKPENLLLDEKSNIKLADFGLSNCYTTGEMLDTPCGSPCYAAPEMVAGRCYSGLSVDIWSSGIVLYAMICGYLPFEDTNTPNLYKKIIKGDYEVPDWLSEKAKDLLKHVLDTNPATRFSINQIRSHPWMENTSVAISHTKSIDQTVITQMKSFGVESSEALADIEANKKNPLTTLYYLLLKKGRVCLPQPPTSLSSQRLQKMHAIRYIDVRRVARPVSRIKINARSVSPKSPIDVYAPQSRTSSRIRRVVVSKEKIKPKEPELKLAMPMRRNHRAYRPAQHSTRLNLSYKSTPRNLETSYRRKTPKSVLSP